jgi:hypothetical protein
VRSKIEGRLAALRDEPDRADVLAALRGTIGVLVAAAVKHVESLGLADELAPAFERLCEQAAKRDPGCRGKIAIARHLHDADLWDERVLARGVTFVQEEPAFGGPVDTAAELRGVCGISYAHAGRPDSLDVLAELLADRDRTARIAAAQGLGDAGRIDASALLRYKALAGDAEPEVQAAVLEALLRVSGAGAIDFVARMLPAHDGRAELAAYALGGSRLAEAVPILDAWLDDCSPRQRREVGYLALALSRDDRATARLADVVRDGDRADALAAAKALATFAADPAMATKIRDAAQARDAALRAEIVHTVEKRQ